MRISSHTRIVGAAATALAFLFGVGAVSPASATDTTAPTVTGVSVSPTTVDVTSAPATITVSVTASDDVGVQSVFVELDSQGSSQWVTGNVYPALSPASGTFDVAVTVPAGMAPGTWTLTYVAVSDTSDNSTSFGPDGVHPFPVAPSTVQVTDSAPDVTGPAFTNFSVTPSVVDVAAGPQNVSFSTTITDDKTGLDQANFTVVDPSGSAVPVDWVDYPSQTGGTPASSTWAGTFTMPQAAMNGTTWHIEAMANDRANNTVDLTPTGATFEVKNAIAAAPGTSAEVDAFTSGPGALEVLWSAPYNSGDPITSYNVRASTDNQVSWIDVPRPASSSATSTDWVVPGLDNAKSYVFEVRAVNGHGAGAWSAPSNAVSPLPAGSTAPSSPTGVTATAGNGSATVSWSAPASNGGSPITGYRIDVSTGGAWTMVTASTPASPYTVTGLANGTTYLFRVIAINAVGYSSPGLSGTVTPAAPAPPAPPVTMAPNPASAANPTFAGAIKSGGTVTATVTLPSGVTVSYQWKLTVKKGHTKKSKVVGSGPSLKLSKAWKNGLLQLVVTYSAPGQPSSVRTITVSKKLK